MMGQNLRELLIARGVAPDAVAKRMCVSPNDFRRRILGRACLSVRERGILAWVLGLSSKDLDAILRETQHRPHARTSNIIADVQRMNREAEEAIEASKALLARRE